MGVWAQFQAGWYELTREDDSKVFRVYLNKVEARMMFSKYRDFGFRSIQVDDSEAAQLLVRAGITK